MAALVFTVTYALISLRRLPNIEIKTWQAALIGAFFMVVLGTVSFEKIPEYLNLDVILLLLGMMLLVTSLELCGFFELASGILIKGSKDGKMMLALVMLISAVLSALVLNDAVVLLMTPIVIRCCRKTECNPVPYLIAVFVSANIGSTATVIGNPQNAYIATNAGIGFLTFSMYMVPLMLICLLVTYVLLALLFNGKLNVGNPCPPPEPVKTDRRLIPLVVILIGMVIMFAVSHTLDLDLWVIAVAGGLASWAIVSTMGLQKSASAVKNVDWGVIAFFMGLFVVMAGVVESGLLSEITGTIPGFSNGNPTVGELTVVTAILSNLLSNVPAVILLDQLIPAGSLPLWLTLSSVSTLAGNMTLIGAAANIIVCEEAEKEGIRLNFWKFLKTGVPVSLVTLLICFVYITAVF